MAIQNLQAEENCVFRNAGVSKENGQISFLCTGDSESHIGDGGDIIHIVSIDQDIDENVTFIKMDIEGMEIDALHGAKIHIEKEHPKLAICIYHKPDDLFMIPKLIDSFYPGYKMSIRQYGRWDTETVLYCYN